MDYYRIIIDIEMVIKKGDGPRFRPHPRKVQIHKEKREKLNERDGEYINHGIIR